VSWNVSFFKLYNTITTYMHPLIMRPYSLFVFQPSRYIFCTIVLNFMWYFRSRRVNKFKLALFISLTMQTRGIRFQLGTMPVLAQLILLAFGPSKPWTRSQGKGSGCPRKLWKRRVRNRGTNLYQDCSVHGGYFPQPWSILEAPRLKIRIPV